MSARQTRAYRHLDDVDGSLANSDIELCNEQANVPDNRSTVTDGCYAP